MLFQRSFATFPIADPTLSVRDKKSLLFKAIEKPVGLGAANPIQLRHLLARDSAVLFYVLEW